MLEQYAARGVFRSCSEVPGRGRTAKFRLRWFRDAAFGIDYDPIRRRITFAELLPDVRPRSELDRELRAFVSRHGAPSLPAHRRLDLRRARVRCVNHAGRVSITVSATRDAHVEYAARAAVHLVHEIFMDLLNDSRYTPYLVEHFNLDPELA